MYIRLKCNSKSTIYISADVYKMCNLVHRLFLERFKKFCDLNLNRADVTLLHSNFKNKNWDKISTISDKFLLDIFFTEEDFYSDIEASYSAKDMQMIIDSFNDGSNDNSETFSEIIKSIYNKSSCIEYFESKISNLNTNRDDVLLLIIQRLGSISARLSKSESVYEARLGEIYFSIYECYIVKVSDLVIKHRINVQAFSLSESIKGCDNNYKVLIRKNWLESLRLMLDAYMEFRKLKPIELDDNWILGVGFFCNEEFTDYECLSQNILLQLSKLNKSKNDLLPGDFLVVNINAIEENGYELYVPNSDIKSIVLEKRFAPTSLFKSSENMKNNVSDIIAEYMTADLSYEEGRDQSNAYESCGRLLLVSVMAGDNNEVVHVTARGPLHVAYVMQLFLPYVEKWGDANPQRTHIKFDDTERVQYEWEGDLWLGANNSCAVVRLEPELKLMFLSGQGLWNQVLSNIAVLKRFVLFEKYVQNSASFLTPDEEAHKEIKHFINDMYSDLRIHIEDDFCITCVLPTNPIDADEQKIRTFLSMFRKVFCHKIVIDEWDEDLSPIRCRLTAIIKSWATDVTSNPYTINQQDVNQLIKKQPKTVEILRKVLDGVDNERVFSDKKLKSLLYAIWFRRE